MPLVKYSKIDIEKKVFCEQCKVSIIPRENKCPICNSVIEDVKENNS